MAIQAEALKIASPTGFDGILKEDVRFATGDTDSPGEALNGWFDRLMLRSGIQTPPAVWLMLCLLIGFSIGGTVFVVSENFPATTAGFFRRPGRADCHCHVSSNQTTTENHGAVAGHGRRSCSYCTNRKKRVLCTPRGRR